MQLHPSLFLKTVTKAVYNWSCVCKSVGIYVLISFSRCTTSYKSTGYQRGCRPPVNITRDKKVISQQTQTMGNLFLRLHLAHLSVQENARQIHDKPQHDSQNVQLKRKHYHSTDNLLSTRMRQKPLSTVVTNEKSFFIIHNCVLHLYSSNIIHMVSLL